MTELSLIEQFRKIISEQLVKQLSETQESGRINNIVSQLIGGFMPLSMPEINWANFHMKPSEYARECINFFKESIGEIRNRVKEGSTVAGNFYVFPTKTLTVKLGDKKLPLNFSLEGYKNNFFELQDGLYYNALTVFVYQDTIIEIIPINNFLHNNTAAMTKAAQKYIQINKINFQQAKGNYEISVHQDVLAMNLVLDITDYSNAKDKTVKVVPKLKRKYVKGAKMEFPGNGSGVIQSVKKIGTDQSNNTLYRLDVFFPEFKKNKVFQVSQKPAQMSV